MSDKKCLWCGKPLTGRQEKYCSTGCKWKHYEDQERKHIGTEVRVCPMCGNHFEVRKTSIKKYCSHRCGTNAWRKSSSTPEVATPELGEPSLDSALKVVSSHGYMTIRESITDETHKITMDDTDEIVIGVVSDTHLGSLQQQPTFLMAFYEYCASRGITKILHAGDMVEGNGHVYKGQTFDMIINGADNLIDYATRIYPRIDGITTYYITGNHEYSFQRTDGMDIGTHIAAARDDIVYLGYAGAELVLGNLRIYLMHPDGGMSYARSYRLQKIIEQFAPEAKPHILLCGHFHVTCHVPMYRNVEGFLLPCFQAQTPFLRRKNLFPVIAGMIITITMDGESIVRVVPEYYPLYVPKERDF